MVDSFFFGDIFYHFDSVFIGLCFIFVFSMIIFTMIKGISQWRKNENSPRLSVPAVVKTKRSDVHGSTSMNNDVASHSSYTTYYVTFEFESGDRLEFTVSGKEYGKLVEEDDGILTFQGTRFIGFERKR